MNEQVIDIKNPANGQMVGQTRARNCMEVKEVVARAKKAQKSWAALSHKERSSYFLNLRKIIIKCQDGIVRKIQSETGKTYIDAVTEVVYVCGAILYFAKNLKEKHALVKKETQLTIANKLALSTNEPWPVVGIISPWNLPLTLAFGEAIPYLMMGSAVILKPSEWTPLTAFLTERMCLWAGIPEGVFQVVAGYGETGASLVESDVDYLAFTGSEKTGKKVAERCGQLLKPYSLELGGKTPFLMLENLKGRSLDRAISCAVWSAFVNAGQYCKSTERLYVNRKHADYVISSIVKLTEKLRAGKDYGPLIPPFQVKIVREHILDALEKNARLLSGGISHQGLRGQWFSPTVLSEVNHTMKIMKEETFGPTLPIMVVDSDEEAIQLANDSNYGLNAVVFSSNLKRGIEVARRIEAGTVTINDALINYMTPSLPYGGVKNSGWGRRHGIESGWETARQKSIFAHRWPFPFRDDLWWFPYTKKSEWIMKHLASMNRFFARW